MIRAHSGSHGFGGGARFFFLPGCIRLQSWHLFAKQQSQYKWVPRVQVCMHFFILFIYDGLWFLRIGLISVEQSYS